MIRKHLLDLNVLIALMESEHRHYRKAQEWFNATGRADWGICPLTEAGFVRVTTNPQYRPVPRTIGQARAALQRLKEYPGYSYWAIDASWETLTEPLAARISGHQQVTDAYLLGMAIQRNGVFVTFDGAVEFLAGDAFRKNVHVLR